MVIRLLTTLFLSLLFFIPLDAQTVVQSLQEQESGPVIIEESGNIYEIPQDIFRNLETNPSQLHKPSEGKPGKPGAGANSKVNGGKKTAIDDGKANLRPGVNKLQGYRIQVFSDGRNPATLQARARARGNAIVAKFPKYRGQVYSFSQSPNWYTRIGNFQTQEEASKALAELKRAFPSFAGEMRVVKSSITIIK